MTGFGRKHIAPVCRALLLLASLHLAMAPGSSAQKSDGEDFSGGNTRLEKITFSSKKGGTLIRIYSKKPFQYITYKLTDPLRFALEIGEVTLGFEPKRSEINGKSVSHISVVPFPEINSVRVELELFAESPVEINRKKGWLEVLVADPASAHMNFLRSSGTANPKRETSLETTNRKGGKNLTDTEIIGQKKIIEQLQMEKASLRREMEENQRRYEEASGKTETLQARVAFMEDQLRKIRTKLHAKNSPGLSGSTGKGRGEIAGPDGSGGDKIYSPKDDIEKIVSDWLDAWRKEEIGRYGDHYSKNFKFGNKNRREWIFEKKVKFDMQGKPNISIGKPEIDILTESYARAKFVQTYRSSRFNSKGVKTLSLTKESGVWKILNEDWSRLK
jgi:hypothetical protein